MPSRLTIAAHMLLLSPLASAAVAVARAPRSAAWLGSPSHASSAAAMVERGKRPPMRDTVKISATRFILVPSLVSWDFRYELSRPRGVERADHPVAQLVHPFQQAEGSHARDAWTVRGLALGRVVNPTALFGDISAASTPLLIASAPGWSSRSRLMSCEPLAALKNLTKEVPRQAACDAREGPALDGDRQDQPGRRR